jgi:RsiW-degrading membrane proteinase PrsW (M82 family)
MPIQIASVPALLAVLLCAGMFVLLFQYLFPRPAPWRLAAVALVAGIIATLVLSLVLRHFVAPGLAGLDGLTSISAALPFAILRAGLPEEATKALGAIIALLPFWRRATPAQAFQASLFVAVGFAVVENQGYASVFDDYAVLIAFGRGFLATLTHTLLAMIFGGFLMRFVANGWRSWHLLLIGYLVAAGCHALYDAGLLPILAEYLKEQNLAEYLKGQNTGYKVDVEALSMVVISASPFIIGGIALVLIGGLWSLRSGIWRAALDDPIVAEPTHQAIVRRWRHCANGLLVLGILGFIGGIAWAIFADSPEADLDDMHGALAMLVVIAAGLFAMIVSWVVRQKR